MNEKIKSFLTESARRNGENLERISDKTTKLNKFRKYIQRMYCNFGGFEVNCPQQKKTSRPRQASLSSPGALLLENHLGKLDEVLLPKFI